jgi:hypothetical protein
MHTYTVREDCSCLPFKPQWLLRICTTCCKILKFYIRSPECVYVLRTFLSVSINQLISVVGG